VFASFFLRRLLASDDDDDQELADILKSFGFGLEEEEVDMPSKQVMPNTTHPNPIMANRLNWSDNPGVQIINCKIKKGNYYLVHATAEELLYHFLNNFDLNNMDEKQSTQLQKWLSRTWTNQWLRAIPRDKLEYAEVQYISIKE
jgi:hypothetical protein